jgi:hypothetical protein
LYRIIDKVIGAWSSNVLQRYTEPDKVWRTPCLIKRVQRILFFFWGMIKELGLFILESHRLREESDWNL